ncbi:MAG: DUF2974 domain-containing protein [Bacillota bacterium]|nr:DUF2974 domain-containing protein [Bacillota bacterium]
MANVLDYIDWRGDLSFEASPVNEIDKYIFAVIGKPDYTGIIPADCTSVSIRAAVGGYFERYPDAEKLGLIASAFTLPVLKKLALSPRYRSVRLSNFINKVIAEDTEQFSALTVHVEGVNYISFRGTDDSIVGWKENCELAVKDSVPAQRDALAYLVETAGCCEGPIVVCGHSKGGNLAIYAASNAPVEIQDRITEVYSYDGPGFMADFLDSEGYLRMESRITTMVPYKSIVGVLLNQAGDLQVIQAEEAGVVGHDGLTWNVTRDGFVRAPELSDVSKFFRTSMAETLNEMGTEDKGELVEEIFEALTSTGAVNLSEFPDQTLRQMLEVANNFRKSDEVRSFVGKMAEKSIKQAKSTFEAFLDLNKKDSAAADAPDEEKEEKGDA